LFVCSYYHHVKRICSHVHSSKHLALYPPSSKTHQYPEQPLPQASTSLAHLLHLDNEPGMINQHPAPRHTW
jgi:hypothetical protein